jgi:hypothetical protein
MFALGGLADAFIGLGADFATTVRSGMGKIVVKSGSDTDEFRNS